MDRLPLFLRMMRRRAQRAAAETAQTTAGKTGHPAAAGKIARYDVRWEAALSVPAADGSPLLTDHYAPVTTEPRPTVLLRAPYIRIGFPWNYLYGLQIAQEGFHVLLQSSRGAGGSGGEFHPWRNEAADGQATVAWLRAQPWFTGELYTLGPSYLSYAQAALALDPPPEWRGAVMQVGIYDPYRFFWSGGAFGLERAMVGGLGLFGRAHRVRDFAIGVLRMRLTIPRAISDVPLLDAYPRIYGGRRPALEEWLDHPAADDPYWKEFDLSPVAGAMTVPVSLCTGWWDLATDQVIEQYVRLRAAGHEPDLLIGPWTHTSALEDGWAELFAQMMRRLRGDPQTYSVRIHVGGADEWRDLPSWPPASTDHVLHLGPGTLGNEPGPGTTTFRYDPADPTPSIGGALQSPTQGQRDNAELEKRSDVVTFTGEPLTAALEVIGAVRAEFAASTTAASGDLFARLCDVDPAGKSINVCDGLARIEPGNTTVELGPTAHRFPAGHRIRLLVAGGAHPRYLRNYGTGEPPGPATRLVSTDTTLGHSSTLVLAVV